MGRQLFQVFLSHSIRVLRDASNNENTCISDFSQPLLFRLDSVVPAPCFVARYSGVVVRTDVSVIRTVAIIVSYSLRDLIVVGVSKHLTVGRTEKHCHQIGAELGSIALKLDPSRPLHKMPGEVYRMFRMAFEMLPCRKLLAGRGQTARDVVVTDWLNTCKL
jgi:hypothetical protein